MSPLRSLAIALAFCTLWVAGGDSVSKASCDANAGACATPEVEDQAMLQVHKADTERSKGEYTVGENHYAIQLTTAGDIYSLSVAVPDTAQDSGHPPVAVPMGAGSSTSYRTMHFWVPSAIGSPAPATYEVARAIVRKDKYVNNVGQEGYLVTYEDSRCTNANQYIYEQPVCQDWFIVQHAASTSTTTPAPPPTLVLQRLWN